MNALGSRWDGAWIPDEETLEKWRMLGPGRDVEVIKRRADGTEATRYMASVVESEVASPWIEVQASWTMPDVAVSGLTFVTGDTVREYFSPRHPFNAFALVDPHGTHRGWYGNVTYPAFLLPGTALPALVWHDLVLDAVVLPGEGPIMLDDDELPDAVILGEAPGLRDELIAAREHLVEFIRELDRQRLAK